MARNYPPASRRSSGSTALYEQADPHERMHTCSWHFRTFDAYHTRCTAMNRAPARRRSPVLGLTWYHNTQHVRLHGPELNRTLGPYAPVHHPDRPRDEPSGHHLPRPLLRQPAERPAGPALHLPRPARHLYAHTDGRTAVHALRAHLALVDDRCGLSLHQQHHLQGALRTDVALHHTPPLLQEGV